LVELAGGVPPSDLDGVSLLPVLDGHGGPTRDVAISEVDGSLERKPGSVRAVRSERYKLIESSINGSEALFDLSADPSESHDLHAERTDVAHSMRRAAAGPQRAPRAPATAVTPDDALREQLRALGYVE
jgi:arylsulfatase A-like enzyme